LWVGERERERERDQAVPVALLGFNEIGESLVELKDEDSTRPAVFSSCSRASRSATRFLIVAFSLKFSQHLTILQQRATNGNIFK